jgi:hypothetical protein
MSLLRHMPARYVSFRALLNALASPEIAGSASVSYVRVHFEYSIHTKVHLLCSSSYSFGTHPSLLTSKSLVSRSGRCTPQ